MLFISLYLTFTLVFGYNLNNSKNIYVNFLTKLKNFDKSSKNDSPPKIIIHFLWSKKCDYCFDGYTSLLTLQKDYSSHEVLVKSYFVGELKNLDLKSENSKMPAFNHINVEMEQLSPPPTLKRFPVFIIENNLHKELELYTGYSDERNRYIKNLVYQKVRPQGGIK